ncbi:MAG: RDD family protein [Candidatus Acidoferrales bacterium]
MDCPCCGISVFAELNTCRTCGWQLSRPFHPDTSFGRAPGNGRSHPRPGNGQPAAPIQTAADAFVLSPPAGPQRIARGRRASRRRQAGRHPAKSAVATLPPQARWPRRRRGWEMPARFEVIELPLVQSAFDFEAAAPEGLAARAAAPLAVRFQAGLLDATLILLASALFFGLFALLSGQVLLARRDLLVYLLAGFVLTSLYFGLFTLFSGRTPGMQYYGLHAVGFDGQPLTPPRAVRRAFGYGVSTGSLLLGFCWALLDDRHLTWHDHISQTFLTHRSPL